MDEQHLNTEETLHFIRQVEEDPASNQRSLSQKLNISLGKTNYLIKELAKKGIIEIVSFSTHPGKTNKLKYMITPKGIAHKAQLTYYYLKLKEKEYNQLKEEYDKYNSLAHS